MGRRKNVVESLRGALLAATQTTRTWEDFSITLVFMWGEINDCSVNKEMCQMVMLEVTLEWQDTWAF